MIPCLSANKVQLEIHLPFDREYILKRSVFHFYVCLPEWRNSFTIRPRFHRGVKLPAYTTLRESSLVRGDPLSIVFVVNIYGSVYLREGCSKFFHAEKDIFAE